MQLFANRPVFSPLWQKLQQWTQPQILISSTSAGLVTGTIAVIRAISYASLIFSGTLALQLPRGLGMTVFSTLTTLLLVSLTSGWPGMIATPLAAPTAVIAILATDIANDLPDASDTAVLVTVLMAIAVSTLLIGALLLVLAWLRQGDRIRFVPYPVIGGFMAGTGWLLTKGFMQVATGRPFDINLLQELTQPEVLWCWLPGFVFAIALLTATRLWQRFWVMPAVLLLCTASFFAVLQVADISLADARAAGWLLGPFPEGEQLWQPLTWQDFQQVKWSAIAAQTDTLFTVVFVSLLSLLLSNSSIELVVGKELDLNREMQSVGLANLISGFGSGMPGSQAMPSTLLVNDLAANYRLTGLIAVLPSVAVLTLGSSFLSYLPKAVLGSLILYLGLSLLWQWLYDAYFKLPLGDYLTVLVTLVLIDRVGFLPGIVVGFVLTVVLFMVGYSQVDVAKQVFSGATARSNTLSRTPEQESLLAQRGSQIYALELQGFLFFGTAHYLLSKVRDRVAQSADSTAQSARAPNSSTVEPLRYVIIDFRQVTGLDSSAVLTFNKILKLAQRQDFILVLTNLLPVCEKALERGRGLDFDSDRCQVLPDLDRGLEWCEQQILIPVPALPSQSGVLPDLLSDRFLTPAQATLFCDYLEARTFPAAHSLYGDGQPTDLYFIESGEVDVLLHLDDGRTKRLQTCASGQLLGEMRFYNKVPLSNSVVTKTPCRLFALTSATYQKLQTAEPDVVEALQRHIVELLCESLMRRGEQLRVMQ
ncbi:MAG: SulP family inorganic anion transporter [Leptolyngbyaceae cyanobacterium]